MAHFIDIANIPPQPNTCNVTRLPKHKEDNAANLTNSLDFKTKLASELISRFIKNPEQISKETKHINETMDALFEIEHALLALYANHFAPITLKTALKHANLCTQLLLAMRGYKYE